MAFRLLVFGGDTGDAEVTFHFDRLRPKNPPPPEKGGKGAGGETPPQRPDISLGASIATRPRDLSQENIYGGRP